MGRILGVVALLMLVLLAGGIAAAWAPDRPVDALKPRWAGAPSRFIEVGGQQVHLRDEGPRDDPMPIVLIHGTVASLHTWEGWAAALRGERRVVSFDLPGFGLTGPNARGDYGIAADTRFVLDLLDTLKIERCVLAGNSLGGEIAWHTALLAPQRVERLVLVDAGGYPFTTRRVGLGFRLARMLLVRGLSHNVLPRSLVARSVREVYGDPSRVDETLIDRYYELTLREGNRRALARRFEQLQPGADSALIATLKVPTLILWGGRDRLFPPEDGRAFARDIAGSRLVLFDELGHLPHEEDPARSVAELRRFLGMVPAVQGRGFAAQRTATASSADNHLRSAAKYRTMAAGYEATACQTASTRSRCMDGLTPRKGEATFDAGCSIGLSLEPRQDARRPDLRSSSSSCASRCSC